MKLLFIFLLLSPISFIVRAMCLTKLWQWFIAPLGIPEISLAHAVGILSTVFLLLAGLSRHKTEIGNETDIIIEVLSSVIVFLLVTVIAGVIKFVFMG